MKVLLNSGYTEAEFLEVRKNRIGGSDIAAIAGLNKFRTPLQVWLEKTGREKPVAENDYMWLGKRLEPIVAELFCRKTNKVLKPIGQVWGHPVHDFAIATPDYQLCEYMPQSDPPYVQTETAPLVEIKTSSWRAKEFWGEDKAPDYAVIQLQWQLEIGGIDSGYVAGLIGGNPEDFFKPHILRNKDIANQLLDVAHKFMGLVKSDTPPAAKAGDAEMIQKLYPNRTEAEVLLPESSAMMFQRYDQLKEIIKRSEDEQETIKNNLMMLVKEGGTGKYADRRAYWTRYQRKEFTSQAVDKMIFKIK